MLLGFGSRRLLFHKFNLRGFKIEKVFVTFTGVILCVRFEDGEIAIDWWEEGCKKA